MTTLNAAVLCCTVKSGDARSKPETTGPTTKTLAANAAHLARLLHDAPYPKS